MSVLWRDQVEPAPLPVPKRRPRAQAARRKESWLEIVGILAAWAWVLWYVGSVFLFLLYGRAN